MSPVVPFHERDSDIPPPDTHENDLCVANVEIDDLMQAQLIRVCGVMTVGLDDLAYFETIRLVRVARALRGVERAYREA